MSDVVNLDITVRQGAEYRAEYKRVYQRYRFEAATAGTSDASAPTWPTIIDDTVTDNTVTWMNKGLYEETADLDVWLPSTGYARRAKIVNPVAAFDLTSYTGAFQIRADVDAATSLHAGTVTFGTRVEGLFSMVIATADTAAFTFDSAVYDLELSTPTGEVDFVLRGNVHLIKEVTR
jgi:hypothetical protein